MNCRLSAVALLAVTGLVPGNQAANAGTPTHRQATATATILPMASIKSGQATNTDAGKRDWQLWRNRTVKYIDADGHLVAVDDRNAHLIIILDLP